VSTLGDAALPATMVLLVLAVGFACAPNLAIARSPRPEAIATRSIRSRGTRRPAARVLAATSAATVSIAMLGPIPTAAVAVAVWGRGRVITLLSARRARLRRERDLPDAIELLVLTVQAGLTPHQAVRNLVSIAPPSLTPAFESVCHRLDRGDALADAMTALHDEIGAGADPVVDAIASAERYGLPLAPVLERLAGEARSTRRRLGEADARRLPITLSFPLVVCTLPSFVLLAIAPSVLAAISSLGNSAW
jgi:tight adherence protein C